MAKLNINGAPTIDYSEDGWNEFKKWIDGTYATFPYAWVDEGPAYQVIVVGKIARTCSINKADATDFETNWMFHQCPLEQITEHGELITAPTYSAIDDSGRFQGDAFVASGLATTIHDWKVEQDLRIAGADWWTTHHEWGDFGSFAVVDKDDVLGLFDLYGLEEGEVLELKRYVMNVPLPCSKCCPYFTETMEVANPAFVCSGLYLRCIVDNNHDGDITVGAVYHLYLET